MVVKWLFISHQYFHQDATLKTRLSDFSLINILTLGGHQMHFYEREPNIRNLITMQFLW
jgi:hypothetical protein